MATIAEMLVRLGMDASGLKQGAGQAKQELSGLEKSMKGVEQAGKTMSSMGQALTASVTLPLIGVGAALAKFTSDAASMVKVRAAFEGVAEAAGSSGDAILEAMRKGSQGMMSNIEMMKNFNLASNLVSKDFAVRLPEAFQYLGKVAAATGQTMDYMMNSLILGVGRLSPKILDNLAIQVDMQAAYEEYAKTLGKSTDELTKAEQQTAIMNKTMELLKANTEAMPDNFGSVTASLKATFQNAKDAIGETLIPVLGTVTGALTGAIEKIVEMTTKGGNLYPVIQNLGEAFEKTIGKITNFVEKIGELDPAWVATIADIVGFVAVLGPALLITGKITTGIVGIGTALTGVMTAFGATAAAATAALGPIALAIAAIAALAILIVKDQNTVNESAQNTVAGMNKLAEAVNTGVIEMPTYTQLVADINRGYITMEQALATLPTKISSVTNAQNDQIDAIFAASTSYEDYTAKMAAAGIEVGNVTEELWASEKAIAATAEATAVAAEQSVVYATRLEFIANNLGTYKSLMTDINAKQAEYDAMPGWKKASKEGKELLGTIDALKGSYAAMVAQVNAQNLYDAIFGNEQVTEKEYQTYLDYLNKTGLASKDITDQMMADWKETEAFKNTLNFDVNGDVYISTEDALLRIQALKRELLGIERNIDVTISVNQMGTLAGLEVKPGLRAEGGDVARKNVYIVGEKGPEIFVPNTDGQIIPNHKIGDYASSLNSGGAGSVVTNNYNLSMPTTANAGDVKMAFELMEAWST